MNDKNSELRAQFEAQASDPSFKFAKSRKGTYVNPALARDWKWFQAGAARLPTEAAAMAATVPAEPVYWEFRWKDTHPQTVTSGQWYPWEKIEPRNGRLETVESRLAELRGYIAQGKCYELRALYAAPQAPVAGQLAEPSPADDGGTPGPWFVRTREKNGKVLGCFVAAPDCQGMAYDAEILGDDEYRDTDEDEDAGIKRRLADCHLIVAAVNAYRLAPREIAMADAPLTLGGCPSCGSRSCVAMQCSRVDAETLADQLRSMVNRATPSPPVAVPPAAPDTTTLEAAMRAIEQALSLIGEPQDERMRTVRRVLRGAVVIAEDAAAQPQPQPAQPLTGAQADAIITAAGLDYLADAHVTNRAMLRKLCGVVLPVILTPALSEALQLVICEAEAQCGEAEPGCVRCDAARLLRAHFGITAPSTLTPSEVAPGADDGMPRM